MAMLESHPTLRLQDIARFKTTDPWIPLEQGSLHFTYNARAAIYRLLRSLPRDNKRTVLLPAFHCFAVVEPVLRAGYQPIFYRICEDLSLDYKDLFGRLSDDVAAVFVIHYCGFPTSIDDIVFLKKRYDFYLIEDWAHSFISNEQGILTGDKGDASIFSFYKLVPSYAGGCVRINTPSLFDDKATRRLGIKKSAVIIKRLVEQLIDNTDDGILRSAFRYVERKRVTLKKSNRQAFELGAGQVSDAYLFDDNLAFVRMPWFSRTILRGSDTGSIVRARRRNFEILHRYLQESGKLRKILQSLPENVCPWAYPVLVTERSRYDHVLRSQAVPVFTFGEVLHSALQYADPSVRASAEFLSNSLMMIPLHQNLTSENMISICEKINALLSSQS
jgi:dTDP-4-amino-4,6-dideoxygalactose transaminase